MNDEIKETIQQLKNGITYSDNICECDDWLDIGKYDAKKLLDYITNLQQEIQRKDAYIKYLEEYNSKYYKGEKFYGDSREELQQRIDKAVETINYYASEDDDCGKIYNDEEKELLDILKGDDENENT